MTFGSAVDDVSNGVTTMGLPLHADIRVSEREETTERWQFCVETLFGRN